MCFQNKNHSSNWVDFTNERLLKVHLYLEHLINHRPNDRYNHYEELDKYSKFNKIPFTQIKTMYELLRIVYF